MCRAVVLGEYVRELRSRGLMLIRVQTCDQARNGRQRRRPHHQMVVASPASRGTVPTGATLSAWLRPYSAARCCIDRVLVIRCGALRHDSWYDAPRGERGLPTRSPTTTLSRYRRHPGTRGPAGHKSYHFTLDHNWSRPSFPCDRVTMKSPLTPYT